MGWPLHARTPFLESVSGRHRSPVRGSSLEFAVPPTCPETIFRRVDWRAWGRSDRYFIKEFEADTNLRLCLIVDTSGSMGFQPSDDSPNRLDYARRVAGALAYIAAHQGDAVGLYCAGKEFKKEITPKRGAAHIGVILDAIAEMEPSGETGLPEVLHQAAEKVPQRALFVVISDLFVEPSLLQDCFQHLRFRNHDLAIFHLLDEQEVTFDFERPTRFQDMEGDRSLLADPSTSSHRNIEKLAQAYLEALDKAVRDAGVDYHRVQVQDNYEEVLARFLIRRTPKKEVAMSFLQPGILLGLPLLALPIIIHLVNRQRHRTVNWAAMRFLLDARRMSTGMARIRQWLILLMRMLIIAGIVMAISRPLAGLVDGRTRWIRQ